VTIKRGEALFEPRREYGENGYIRGLSDVANTGPGTHGYVPANDVTLVFRTFTEAANQSGISRLYGGIHIRSSDLDGRRVGRYVGDKVWAKYQSLLIDLPETQDSAGSSTSSEAPETQDSRETEDRSSGKSTFVGVLIVFCGLLIALIGAIALVIYHRRKHNFARLNEIPLVSSEDAK
jgi:hypothetical protein